MAKSWGSGRWGSTPWGGQDSTEVAYEGNLSLSASPASSDNTIAVTTVQVTAELNTTSSAAIAPAITGSSIELFPSCGRVAVNVVDGGAAVGLLPQYSVSVAVAADGVLIECVPGAGVSISPAVSGGIASFTPAHDMSAVYSFAGSCVASLLPNAGLAFDIIAEISGGVAALTPSSRSEMYFSPATVGFSVAIAPGSLYAVGIIGALSFSLTPSHVFKYIPGYFGAALFSLSPSCQSITVAIAPAAQTAAELIPGAIVFGWRETVKESTSFSEVSRSSSIWTRVTKEESIWAGV